MFVLKKNTGFLSSLVVGRSQEKSIYFSNFVVLLLLVSENLLRFIFEILKFAAMKTVAFCSFYWIVTSLPNS